MTLQQIKKDAKLLATRLKSEWLVLRLGDNLQLIKKSDYVLKKPEGKIIFEAKPTVNYSNEKGEAKKKLRNLKQKKYRDNKNKKIC